jgi:beta-mannanase
MTRGEAARLAARIVVAMIASALTLVSVLPSISASSDSRVSPSHIVGSWSGTADGQSDDNLKPAATIPTHPALGMASVALGLYQPVFPDDLSALDRYEQMAGRKMSIIHWYAHWGDWKSAFDRADLDRVAARGSLPMITWEPWIWDASATGPDPAWSLRNGILSGRFDTYIDSWASGLAAYGKPVLLRFAHEMHDNAMYPWAVGINGNTADDYVRAWKHVRALFARYDTSNVRWVWNPHTMGDARASVYSSIYSALYPGDEYVDVVGLDIYNTGPGLDWGAPSWRTFSQVLSEPYRAVASLTDKPLILPEVGCTEVGGDKADWLASAFSMELSQFPRVAAVVWFDVDKEQQWQLHSSPAALQSWAAASRSHIFDVQGLPF